MRLLLLGFGAVGQSFASLIEQRSGELLTRFGLAPRLVAVADRGGFAASETGLSAADLLQIKKVKGTVAAHPHFGRPARNGSAPHFDTNDLIRACDVDVLIEASPSNLQAPQAATSALRTALGRGIHAVCVNKAPLATAMPALLELAAYNRVQLRFSGTVGAGTTVLATAERCAVGDRIIAVRAILNGTTNFILTQMHRHGSSFDAALAEAQRLGYAETDPSNDVDGIDTAMKIVIIANAVVGRRVTFRDASVNGIRSVSAEQMIQAAARGKTIKLIGRVDDSGIRIAPEEIDAGTAMDVSGGLNAVTFSLETGGDVTLIGRGAGGPETATAIVRDLVDIWRAAPHTRH